VQALHSSDVEVYLIDTHDLRFFTAPAAETTKVLSALPLFLFAYFSMATFAVLD